MSCTDDEKVLSAEAKEDLSQRLLDYEAQNPAPVDLAGQTFEDRVRQVADRIMRVFLGTLPSNYVSQVNGPWYSLQFQAMIEQLARYQVEATEVYENLDYDFTRPEFLFQVLGVLVFPDTTKSIPSIDGDITYRDFLKAMVRLLLQGSTKDTVREGAGLLTEGVVSIIEKFQFPESVWGLDEQFGFELFIENFVRTSLSEDGSHYHEVTVDCDGAGSTSSTVCIDGFTCIDHEHEIEGLLLSEVEALPEHPLHDHRLISAFPLDAITLQENIVKIVKALKPAHTLYELSFLFREIFGRYDRTGGDLEFIPEIFEDTSSWKMFSYYYDDLRKYCWGAKEITSTEGETPVDRTLFSDPTRSFRPVPVCASLTILDGPNEGVYEVREILVFPVGDDATAYPYTTSPTGLSGTAIIDSGAINDSTQDFGAVVKGETLTFTSGPNAGTYLLEVLLGSNGGYIGHPSTTGPATSVRPVPSILRIDRRMDSVATGQSYLVGLDRLGVAVPKTVDGEDASLYFYI